MPLPLPLPYYRTTIQWYCEVLVDCFIMSITGHRVLVSLLENKTGFSLILKVSIDTAEVTYSGRLFQMREVVL